MALDTASTLAIPRGLGHIPDDPDDRDHIVDMSSLQHRGPPPPSFWIGTAKNGAFEPLIIPVYDQGSVNSCVTNAVAAAYRYELKRVQLKDYYPSRLFMYYHARLPQGKFEQPTPQDSRMILKNDEGCSIRDVLKILVYLYPCSEYRSNAETYSEPHDFLGEWPYDTRGGGNSHPSIIPDYSWAEKPPHLDCYTAPRNHLNMSYAHVLLDVTCWKQCIRSGHPIIFAFRMHSNFNSCSQAPFLAPAPTYPSSSNDVGGHVVIAVGWDDSKQAFKIQNSWGDWWGDKGHFWMPYAWLTLPSPGEPYNMIIDPWILVLTGFKGVVHEEL